MSETTTKKTTAERAIGDGNAPSANGETANEAGSVAVDNYDVDLRNPWLAAVLAWLVPGLGHWYQRRYAKAAIFALGIWPILLAGLYMGSYWEDVPTETSARRLLFARNVYWSWRPGDKRLYFVPQATIGVIAIPAWFQARDPSDGKGGFWSTAFAPPRLPSEASTRAGQPSADEIVANLHSWLDVGTLYVVVAGLLNLLVIFDALGGAVRPPVDEGSADEEADGKKKIAANA